jgi:hypothetical protein
MKIEGSSPPMAQKRELIVKSAVIHWQEGTLEITDTAGNKYTVPLDYSIDVTMVGYPDKEQKTMLARELGPYMSRGYIIQQIDFEEIEGS